MKESYAIETRHLTKDTVNRSLSTMSACTFPKAIFMACWDGMAPGKPAS